MTDEISQEVRRLVDAARTVWTKRLIDPSRANSLLFYRDLNVGTLDLSEETDVVERLLKGEKLSFAAISFDSPQDGDNTWTLPFNNDGRNQRSIRSTLVAIQRKALSNLEEKGIETLHLAIGMATWPAGDGGRPYAAPVMLLPARIEMRGRGDDIRLQVAGDPRLNPVLLHILEEHFQIRIDSVRILSEFGIEDDNGNWRVDVDGVLKQIARDGRAIKDFKVMRRVVLANFQFAKMAMVEDLKNNGDMIASSSVVAAIAGDLNSRRALASGVDGNEVRDLDDRRADEDFLVLDADSSQHRSILLIGKGQSGVIQGPPGTGKSQTISNLIAQSVAEGCRVLFVAEKRAALDAVMKRLKSSEVGLGHLVLDLHGASVSRKEVMARLNDALQQIRSTPTPLGVEAIHQDFELTRTALNQHAKRINKEIEPTQFSLHQIIGELLRLPESAKSDVRFSEETLSQLTLERSNELRSLIKQSKATPKLLLGVDPSPWNMAVLKDGSDARGAVELARNASQELLPRFERLLESVIKSLNIKSPECLGDVHLLLELLRDAREIRELYGDSIFKESPADLANALEPVTRGTLSSGWALLTNSQFRYAKRYMNAHRIAPASLAKLRDEAETASSVVDRWEEHKAETSAPVEVEGEIDLALAFAELQDTTDSLSKITKTSDIRQLGLKDLRSWIRRLAEDSRTPFQLPGVIRIRSLLIDAGLKELLDDLRDADVDPAVWPQRYDHVRLSSAFERALAEDSELARFNGRTHQTIVEEFANLDRQRVKIAAARVKRLHAQRAIEAMNEHFEQANLVRSEASKRSRHIPVRDLLARAPDVLTRIAPCWVASPLSVSQLLDGDRRHFDIVIFDEASQILQEEAIPALYRADRVVVAGDRHQLPPTTFFATAIEGEDETSDDDDESQAFAVATAAIGGFESLLGTLEAFLPNWLLEWHYRSEDERLITFSNTNIYDGRLVTFPSARDQKAIRHTIVEHDPALGGQEESASKEVDEVVRQVLSHAENRSSETLGVITMGIKHANRIQAKLDIAMRDRPDLSEFFSLEKEDRFFIKNLETVQGDERDVIILSIGYGKAANGDLPHRFGPLSQDVGYRRLNVAVTRAKRRMSVISSFSHNEINLERSGSRGVQLLKAYLEYASNGGTRLVQTENAGEVGLNAFEADVKDALQNAGIPTRSQFGASRYRIDLVAMHPRETGRPVLAIECDGATYHSGATARDRDRLRQAHLERLGWRFHRIWSTDWFFNRQEEIARAVSAYEAAVLQDGQNASVRTEAPIDDDDSIAILSDSKSNDGQRGLPPHVPRWGSIDDFDDGELKNIMRWVMSDGDLRTDEEIIRETFELLPFTRLGARIRYRLSRVVQTMRRNNELL